MPKGISDPKLDAALLLFGGSSMLWRGGKAAAQLIRAKGVEKGVKILAERGMLRARVFKEAMKHEFPEVVPSAKQTAAIGAGLAVQNDLSRRGQRAAFDRYLGSLVAEGEIDTLLKQMGGTVPAGPTARKRKPEFSTSGQPALRLLLGDRFADRFSK